MLNLSYTDATYSIFEKVFATLMIGRLILLVASFKYPRVTKLMIYNNLLMALI